MSPFLCQVLIQQYLEKYFDIVEIFSLELNRFCPRYHQHCYHGFIDLLKSERIPEIETPVCQSPLVQSMTNLTPTSTFVVFEGSCLFDCNTALIFIFKVTVIFLQNDI